MGIHKAYDGNKLWSVKQGVVAASTPSSSDELLTAHDSDTVTYEDVKDNCQSENNEEHYVQGSDAQLSWVDLQREMEKVETYADLKRYCSKLSLPPLPAEFLGKFRRGIDKDYDVAKGSLKSLKISSQLHAVPVKSDGNCFLRALSLQKFGTEDEHVQLRVRLVLHAVLNDAVFLDNKTFKHGCHANCKNYNFTERYSQYSDEYNPSVQLEKEEIQAIYEREWLAYRMMNCWSGVYQLHVAADCLKVQLNSHYPNMVIRSIFEDLNRAMYLVGGVEPEATLDVL